MFEAAFATQDITPEIGSRVPGMFGPRNSTGIIDPLQARACVLRSGDTELAIVGVDAVSLRFDTVASARSQIADMCAIPPDHILIAASHTHSGGPSNDVLGTDSDPDYCALVAGRIANAVAMAHAGLQKVSLATVSVPCAGWAFNRRFTMKTGGEATNPGKGNPDLIEPAGPTDPDVTAIVFRSMDGRILGMIGNFTCHCTVLGGVEFSGDYPAYWQKTLQDTYGEDFTLVFLNGACGDINQLDFLNTETRESGVGWATQMGKALADVVVSSTAGAEFATAGELSPRHGEVFVKYRRPDADALAAARALVESESEWTSKKWQARDVLLLAEMIGDAEGTECPVDVFQIGNAAICAAPWQPFCEFGLRIKKASPFSPTLIATFANGMLGYVPTPKGFEGGGYEPTLCRGSKLTPDAGDRIVAETVRLLRGDR